MINATPRDGPRVFQALAIKQGLIAIQRGFQVNRAYTSTACLRTAGNITGKTYGKGAKAREEAIADLTQWLEEAKAQRNV